MSKMDNKSGKNKKQQRLFFSPYWLLVLPATGAFLAGKTIKRLLYDSSFQPPSPGVDNKQGHHGENHAFKVASWGDVPYIMENGLPYPTHFNYTSNEKVLLNGAWWFRLDKKNRGMVEKWPLHDFSAMESDQMEIPGCFNTMDSPLWDYEGTVWYQKSFQSPLSEPPAEDGEKYWIRLALEGVFLHTEVWLNGWYLGCNDEGYLPFYFDITSYLQAGENTLTVRVNNETGPDTLPPKYPGYYPHHRLGWHPFGGIHKDVSLDVCREVNCFKLRARPVIDDAGDGQVTVEALFQRRHIPSEPGSENNSEDVEFMVIDPEGNICTEFSGRISFEPDELIAGKVCTFEVDTPWVWSPQSPHLYCLQVKTSYEQVAVNFGFRNLVIDGNKILINGMPVRLKGVARHEEDRPHGLAQSPDSSRLELQMIKDMGSNFVRLAHYPHASQVLDFCDQMGLYSWEEIAYYQAGLGILKFLANKSAEDRMGNPYLAVARLSAKVTPEMCNPRILHKARKSLLKMVERDANHPSIIIWGVGNECWSFNPAAEKALRWLKTELLRFDSSRPVSYASFTIPFLSKNFERAFNVVDIIAINEYFGWYYGQPEDAVKYVEAVHGKYPHKPILISETGADSVYGKHDLSSPPPKGYSEEYQAHLLQTQWDMISTKPYFAGWSIWVLKDFFCPEYRHDNPVPYYNLKGLVTRDYEKKLSLQKLVPREK